MVGSTGRGMGAAVVVGVAATGVGIVLVGTPGGADDGLRARGPLVCPDAVAVRAPGAPPVSSTTADASPDAPQSASPDTEPLGEPPPPRLEPRDPQSPHTDDPEPSRRAARASGPTPAGLLAAPRRSAVLGRDGMRFTARDDAGAASELTFALEAIERGAGVLYDARRDGPGRVLVDGHGLRARRLSGVEEVYVARPSGVEQLFRFETVPAGSGDLVVRGRLETGLDVEPAPDGGFVLEGGEGPALAYGRAVVFDASGRSVEAPLALAGDVLELRVPDAWLAGATGPVVIDPVIGDAGADESELTPPPPWEPDPPPGERASRAAFAGGSPPEAGTTPASGELVHSSSPILIASPGPEPTPDEFGNFLVCVGTQGTGFFVQVVDASGDPLPGVDVTGEVSEEMSFSETEIVRTKVVTTDADGVALFPTAFIQASATAKAATFTSSVEGGASSLGPNPLVGTVVGIEEPPTTVIQPDPIRGETVLHPGDPTMFTATTQPPGFEGLLVWFFDRQDGADFSLFLEELTTDSITVDFLTPDPHLVAATCRFTGSAPLLLADPAPHEIAFAEATSESASEAPTDVTLELVGGRLLLFAAEVDVVDAGAGTATAGVDYADFGRTRVAFPVDGQFGTQTTFSLPVEDDDPPAAEPDETVALALEAPSAIAALGAGTEHSVTVVDDDPVVRFVAASGDPLPEGADPPTRDVLVEAALLSGRPLPEPVALAVAGGGTATLGADYRLPATSLTFPAGDPNGAQRAVVVEVLDDLLAEGEETASLTLSRAGPDGDLQAPLVHTIPLEDDDLATLAFVSATSAAAEPDADPAVHAVAVELFLPDGVSLAADVTVDVVLLAGSTAEPGADAVLAATELVFPADSASAATALAELAVQPDDLIEGEESLVLALSAPSAGAELDLDASEHTVAMADADAATLRFATASSSIREGTTQQVAAVLDLGGAELTVGVEGAVATGGTATRGDDYMITSADLAFPAASPSGATAEVAVSVLADAVADDGETIALTLEPADPAAPLEVGAPATHVITVEDVPVGDPDFVLIGPKPALVLAGEEKTFTLFGVSNGPNGVRDTTGPDAGAFSLAGDDVLLGPVAADWALRPEPSAGPPADRGRDRGPQLPDVELVGGADGVTSVVVRAGFVDAGGVLRPGLIAHATERRLGRDRARVVVPWLKPGIEIVDPVPIITSSHLEEVQVGLPPDAVSERPPRALQDQNTVAITPGRLRPDSRLRNLLRVRVIVGPEDEDALVGTRLFFRSVDVDDQAAPPVDPTDAPGEPDNRSDAFDDVLTGARIEVPAEGALSATSDPIRRDAQGRLVASVDLTVSFSPGDNYRVVASLADDFVVKGQPLDPRALPDDWEGRDDPDAAGDEREGGRVVFTVPTDGSEHFVAGSASETRVPIRSSDVITVWRVVHVETDAMEEVDVEQQVQESTRFEGRIAELAPGEDTAEVTLLDVEPGIPASPSGGADPDFHAALAEGLLDIPISARQSSAAVIREFERLGPDSARLEVVVNRRQVGLLTRALGERTTFRDDDDIELLADDRIAGLVDAGRALMAERMFSFSQDDADSGSPTNAYAEAFIVFAHDGGGDPTNDQLGPSRVPFQLSADPARENIDPHFGAHGRRRDPAFLVTYLLLSYQPEAFDADNDPNEEFPIVGQAGGTSQLRGTAGKLGGAFLHVEVMRDLAREVVLDDPDGGFATLLRLTAAHETWHSLTTLDDFLPGQDPNNRNRSSGQGLMATPSPILRGEQPLRFSHPFDVLNLRRVVERYAKRVR